MPLYRAPLTDRVRVKNTSGATAAANDAGYIDAAGEYKTTTTSRFQDAWCVVLVGGANNSDIYVARRGRVNVAYTSTAPSAGHFLSLSTVAGDAQRETVCRPEIFAVCTAAGSGGLVETLLLTQRVYLPMSASEDVFRVNSGSDTLWTGTINGAPSATSVTVTTSTGALDSFAPNSTGELCKPVVFNSTRSTSRLITAINTGTGVLTTENTSDAWANTDALTVKSQTNTQTESSGNVFIDLDGGGAAAVLHALDVLLFMYHFQVGADDAANAVGFHPFEAYSSPKHLVYTPANDGGTYIGNVQVPLIGRKFTYTVDANGAAACTHLTRIIGVLRAAP